MDKKPFPSAVQNDVAGTHPVKRDRFDMEKVARPESRKHAVTTGGKCYFASRLQNFRGQVLLL